MVNRTDAHRRGPDRELLGARSPGRLVATTDAQAAVADTEIALVCVARLPADGCPPRLPSSTGRGPDRRRPTDARTRYTVAIRSTMLPVPVPRW